MKNYWLLKAKQVSTVAEIQDQLVKQYEALLDEAVNDDEKLKAKIDGIAKQVGDLATQAKDFNAQADKIMADNPSLFEK